MPAEAASERALRSHWASSSRSWQSLASNSRHLAIDCASSFVSPCPTASRAAPVAATVA